MPTRKVDLPAGLTSRRLNDASEIVREALSLSEQREQKEKAKLEWLRNAAKEGFDAIEKGDFVALNSEKEISDFLQDIRKEVSAELEPERNRS